MSEVLKTAITCSIDCLQQVGLSQPDAIIVGTSMGCCVHTKNFLDKILSAGEGPISPTSFIVSTHNTIAGQISLLLKNHGYNMTHTQNSLSFEQSLIDAMLCIQNGSGNVLVGAADEEDDTIYNMGARLNNENIHPSSGSSFFVLSGEKSTPAFINLVDVGSFGLINNPPKIILEFLDSNKLSPRDIDLVLYSNTDQKKTEDLERIFRDRKLFDYEKITGTYFTNAAFAMSYAIDILSNDSHPVFGNGIRRILVCNNLISENLGLILLDTKSNSVETHQ